MFLVWFPRLAVPSILQPVSCHMRSVCILIQWVCSFITFSKQSFSQMQNFKQTKAMNLILAWRQDLSLKYIEVGKYRIYYIDHIINTGKFCFVSWGKHFTLSVSFVIDSTKLRSNFTLAWILHLNSRQIVQQNELNLQGVVFDVIILWKLNKRLRRHAIGLWSKYHHYKGDGMWPLLEVTYFVCVRG